MIGRTGIAAVLLAGAAQDFDQALERGNQLFAEAKAMYESAKPKGSLEGLNDAAFKLEEARVKFLAVQELAAGAVQKTASDRLREAQQLARLIADGKKAALEPPPPAPTDPAKPAVAPPPVPVPAVPPAVRRAIPEASEQIAAEKTIRELFKADYAKKDAASRKALARKLLQHAQGGQDPPPVIWVLAVQAQEIAASIGDADTAYQAAEFLSTAFEVSARTMKLGTLAAVAKNAKAAAELRELSERYLQISEAAVAAEDYDQADQALQLAVAAAKKASDTEAAAQFSARAREIAEARTLSASAYRARSTILTKDPSDAAACLEFGRYLCLVRGEWEAGVLFLAKGSDPALQSLAEKELARPAGAADLVALADGWWDASAKEKSALLKAGAKAHARTLYERALPEAVGLAKVKIATRLEEAAKAVPARPIDLLRLVDPAVDGVAGVWSLSGSTLSCTQRGKHSRLQIPYQPPEEYDLTIAVARLEGEGSIYFRLPSGGAAGWLFIDAWSRTVSGLGFIDGQYPNVNDSKVPGAQLRDGKASTVVCAVRKTGIKVTIDGRKVLDWKAGWQRLSEPAEMRLNDPRALSVALHEGRAVFSKITLLPVSGSGQKLR